MRSSAPELLKNVLNFLAYEEGEETGTRSEGVIEESLPICECYNEETKVRSQLLFNPSTGEYKYVGECSSDRICAMIMLQKHEFKIKKGHIDNNGIKYTADLNKYLEE